MSPPSDTQVASLLKGSETLGDGGLSDETFRLVEDHMKHPTSNLFSKNASSILVAAAEHAERHQHEYISTEDLMWAMFRAQQFNAQAEFNEQLEKRAVSLSSNAQKALNAAVTAAVERQHVDDVVHSEDLLWALFDRTERDSRAKHWVSTQHMQLPALLHQSFPSHKVEPPRPKPKKKREEISEENSSVSRLFMVGGLAGSIETAIQQPLVYWKTLAQTNQKISWSRHVVFRGLGINVGSIGPISAIQLAGHGALYNLYHVVKGQPQGSFKVPNWHELGIAAASGCCSTLVVCPAELLMITQQRSGMSLMRTYRQVMSSSGLRGLYRGALPTCIRESGWTGCFLGLAPVIKDALQHDSQFFRQSEVAATAMASILSGQMAAIATQPADVIKTRLQADRGITHPMKFPTMLSCAKALVREDGWGTFFAGLGPRSLRCIGAVFILGQSQDMLHAGCDKYSVLM